MKRKLLFASVSAFLVLVASAALADTYSGTITKLNRSSELLEVRGDEHGRRQSFLLSRKGQVTRDGQAVAFNDLKRGDRVTIDFTRNGTTYTAYSVAVAAGEARGGRDARVGALRGFTHCRCRLGALAVPAKPRPCSYR